MAQSVIPRSSTIIAVYATLTPSQACRQPGNTTIAVCTTLTSPQVCRQPGNATDEKKHLEPLHMVWCIQRDFLLGKSTQAALSDALAPVPNPHHEPSLEQVCSCVSAAFCLPSDVLYCLLSSSVCPVLSVSGVLGSSFALRPPPRAKLAAVALLYPLLSAFYLPRPLLHRTGPCELTDAKHTMTQKHRCNPSKSRHFCR